MGSGAEVFARSLDKSAEFEADRMGVVLAARAGYTPYGLVEVLQQLGARAGSDGSLALLFKTHPHPDERIERLGETMAPNVGNLPAGTEPGLQANVADTQPRRAAQSQQPQQAAQPVIAPPVPRDSLRPERAQKPGSGGGVDPGQILRGIFSR